MSELAGVLVAAGRGSRMGGDKLWTELWGRPIWRWSLDTLLAVPGLVRLAVVVPAGEVERFRDRMPPVADRCLLIEGGETRSASVHAGLVALSDAGASSNTLVLVHDAARPAVDGSLIDAVVGAAREIGAAIPVLAVADTLKRLSDGLVQTTVSRDDLGGAQTPQAASLGILLAALDAARVRGGEPTDEAAALTAIGVPVRAVAGDPANRKLTEEGDLPVLRAILRDRAIAALDVPAAAGGRAGIGFDAHRLETGVPLRLGGLSFPDEPRGLAGHSDGDAALHAVIDALLGAAHLGDVGSHFADGDARWRGADSGELLRLAVERIHDAGFRPRAVDLTIVAVRPSIGTKREGMEGRIAELAGLPADSVNVKGTTSDGLGFAGSEGIAAYAMASVEPTADDSPTDRA